MQIIPVLPSRSRPASISAGLILLIAPVVCQAQQHQPPETFYQGLSISPDGQRIGLSAMIKGNFDVYTFRLDGSDLRRLTSDSAAELWEAWSPDSKQLLYTVINGDQSMDLHTMNLDGSAKRMAPNGAGRGGYASWSPDGGLVLFERKIDSVAQVFVMNRDGTNERRVSHVAGDVGNPRWSPDGRQIVFETATPNVPDQLYVTDVDGSHQVQITHDTLYNVFPNWTADGRVAFIRKGSLYLVNRDGSGERLLRPSVS
jgi:TolB protein